MFFNICIFCFLFQSTRMKSFEMQNNKLECKQNLQFKKNKHYSFECIIRFSFELKSFNPQSYFENIFFRQVELTSKSPFESAGRYHRFPSLIANQSNNSSLQIIASHDLFNSSIQIVASNDQKAKTDSPMISQSATHKQLDFRKGIKSVITNLPN